MTSRKSADPKGSTEEQAEFDAALAKHRGTPTTQNLHNWLTNERNARALRFVRRYLNQRKQGDCFWTAADLTAHLKKEFGLNASFSPQALQSWLKRHDYLESDPYAELREL